MVMATVKKGKPELRKKGEHPFKMSRCTLLLGYANMAYAIFSAFDLDSLSRIPKQLPSPQLVRKSTPDCFLLLSSDACGCGEAAQGLEAEGWCVHLLRG